MPVKPLLGERYQLQRTIGTGGMAVVYLAQDLKLDRQVAIKLLRQRFSRDKSFRERFYQEARAAANLSHPNIVTVYDFVTGSDRSYIVMEYVPGVDLKTMIEQRKRFSITECIALVSQACFGIGYAHRAGLVHCDVKPHNMLVSSHNRLKVTDFGIARALASIHPDEQHDVIWGSPLYFSPEQAAGEAPSPASDVYSLGIILYEMLAGRLPFESEDALELMGLHREAVPPSPRWLNPEIPIELEQIIQKVLSKNPNARYRNAEQLGRVLITLNQQLVSAPSSARSYPYPPKATTNQPQSPITTPSLPPAVHSATSLYREDNSSAAETSNSFFDIDWLTVSIGLIAATAVGGLIPFWLYIWLVLNPPG